MASRVVIFDDSERDYLKTNVQQIEYVKTDLKNFIFFPFNIYWEIGIQINIFVNMLLLLFKYIEIGNRGFLNFGYYVMEIWYFVDVMLAVFHRYMVKSRKRKLFPARNAIMLILELATLVPYWETYRIIYRSGYNPKAEIINRSKCLVRFIRFISFYIAKRNQVGFNQLVLISVCHFIIVGMIGIILSVIWYNIALAPTVSWITNLQHYNINKTKKQDVFMLSIVTISSLLGHHWIGRVRGETSFSRFLVILAMFVGFMMHMLKLNGQLTAIYLKIFRKQHDYIKQLNFVKKFFSEWSMGQQDIHKMELYYKELWDKRNGIQSMPQSFNLLPLALQKEVNVDIFWHALRHSHIFANMDMAFKRELALVMKNDSLLTGDYLFKCGHTKSKMVYIISGVVEILSKEDHHSPILSFSNGTILGEISALVPLTCICHVRCATYCEFYTIELPDLYRVLIKYRSRSNQLNNNFNERVELATTIRNRRSHFRDQNAQEEFAIKKLKRHWRNLAMTNTKAAKKGLIETHCSKSIDPNFCSTFLDLLVFSDLRDLKLNAICLSGVWPFVMHPESAIVILVNYISLIAILYQCLVLPYLAAGFNNPHSYVDHVGVYVVLDTMYLLSVCIQAITAIRVRNTIIQDTNEIVVYRLKQISFLVDIFATLPFDYIASICKFPFSLVNAIRITKVLRFYKLIQFVISKEKLLSERIFLIRFIKFVLIYVLVIYGFNCIFIRMNCSFYSCTPDGWLLYGKKLLDHDVNVTNPNDKFIVGLHYALSIITAITNNNFSPYEPYDMAIYLLALFTGYYITSFMVSQLTATYVQSLNTRHQYRESIRMLNLFFTSNRVPAYIRTKAFELQRFLFLYNGNAIAWGANSVFNKIPEVKEIVSQMLTRAIKNVILFENLDDRIINDIAQISHLYVFPPKTQLCAANTKTIWIYIIMRGYCHMTSSVPGDTDRVANRILSYGDAFPVIESLHLINSFITVTTTTAVEAIMIPYVEIMSLLRFDGDKFSCIDRALELHRKDFQSLLTRSIGLLESEIHKTGKMLNFGKGDYFSYDIYKEDDHLDGKECRLKSRKEFSEPFRKLGRFGNVLMCFMLPRTINPHGKFFLVWEVTRWVFALTEMILSFLQLNVLLEYTDQINIVGHIFFCICTVDFYVRMHCQYFTKEGILVTHPLKTCINYMNTSFAIDFIAAFPVEYTGMGQPFFGELHFKFYRIIRLLHILQIHRLLSGISYFTDFTQAGVVIIRSLKNTLIMMIILVACGNIFTLVACKLTANNKRFLCENAVLTKSWLDDFKFIQYANESNAKIALASVYSFTAMFTGSLCGLGLPKTTKGAGSIMFIMVFLFFMRIILLVWTAAAQVGGNTAITRNQFKVKHFIKYSKMEPVDEDLVSEFVKCSEFRWKKAGGSDFLGAFLKLNQVLIMEVRSHMYVDTLHSSYFFNGFEKAYLNAISYYVKQQSYKKDSIVIRANDINEHLYFVNKGRVDVFMAGSRVAILMKGGCFGCMNKRGTTRHTVTVVVQLHSEILSIRISKLYKIALGNSVLKTRLNEANVLLYEYIKSLDKSTLKTKKSKLTDQQVSTAAAYYRKFNKIINQHALWFIIYNYILNVHIAPLSGLLILGGSFLMYEKKMLFTTMRVMWTIDAVFWLRVFINFHLFYVDTESGLLVTEPKKILLRYIRTHRFYLDILANFPYEIILYYSRVSPDIIRYSVLMRVLRIFFLVEYYYKCKSALNVSILLRSTGLLYTIIIQLTGMSLLWWYISCKNGTCLYLETAGFTPTNLSFSRSNSTSESILISFTYTVNLFTATGLRDIVPLTRSEFLLSLFISLTSVVSISMYCAAFISVLVVNSVTFCDYEYRIEQLRSYLKYRDVSPVLQKKVWWYFLALWNLHQGDHLPGLIQEMPSYLREDLMLTIYGRYLENHHLFAQTHVDFLRQLVSKMRRCIYLPGYNIVMDGDVTECMYFIHKGEVEEFEIILGVENITQIYNPGMSFGEVQGLFTVPYTKNYRALSLVDLMLLRRKDWISLLKWFPASHDEILRQVHSEKYTINPSDMINYNKLF